MAKDRDYTTIYKSDLLEMIDKASIDAIRAMPESKLRDCKVSNYLTGLFAVVDALKARLDDPEVE